MSSAVEVQAMAADGVLLLHFAFVASVVLGFVLIWAGYFAGWRWVRRAGFRVCHVVAMGLVLCESCVGMVCPLTEWEISLRAGAGQGQPYETSFMKEGIYRLMFFELSENTFLVIYAAFFALVLLTFWVVPPELKWGRRVGSSPEPRAGGPE